MTEPSEAHRPVAPGDRLILVDGSSFIFRAYHGLPPLTRKSDGLPVGAVSGFVQMLWRLLREGPTPEPGDEPTHFAVVFDYSSKTFRNDLYAEYKSHRPEPPDDLKPQFGLVRDATRAFSVACVEQQGFEADDLIATYARQAVASGASVIIISSDKDLMQLVGPQVTMVDTMRNQVIGEAEVVEKFGVPPAKMIDMQALIGDPTDNVPGVPGIGPKTAAELLSTFGDLDTLLAGAGTIKQKKRREMLLEHADRARLSRDLVTLRTDVPLDVPLDRLAVAPIAPDKAIGFLKAMEFGQLTRRVAEGLGVDPSTLAAAPVAVEGKKGGPPAHGPDMAELAGPADGESATAESAADTERGLLGRPVELAEKRAKAVRAVPFDHAAYQTVRDRESLARLVEEARAARVIAVDTESTSLDPLQAELVGVSLALAPGRAFYVPLGHRPTDSKQDLFGGADEAPKEDLRQVPLSEALALLKPLLEDPNVLKVGQNLKYDWLLLSRHGIEVAPFDDTMLLSYALEAGRGTHGMDALSERWLGHKPIAFKDVAGSGKAMVTFDRVPIDKATAYAAEDADVTLRLWQVLKPRLAAERVARVYERLERPMVPVLARMEKRGILVDRDILSNLSSVFGQRAAELEDGIYELAGERFNIGSPKQLGEILFDRMSLPGGRRTSSGQWSTDVQMLDDLAAQGHELPRRIVEWRQLTKLKSVYADALPTYVNPETGRVHTSFALASTTTGRLSSTDPNLQNIPIRTEEGRGIRRAFIAAPGHKLVSADYSQIELRLLAHIAEIPQLVEAFAAGQDIHAITASEMFGVPVTALDPALRRQAKTINFGIIYGISAFGLAARLGIPREQAGDYIRTYFQKFPGIRDYIERTKRSARETGYVETLYGRRAHFLNIKHSNQSIRAGAERAAINAPIQGTAADIIRRAMIRMEAALERAGVSARMLLQVHDELVFEVPDEEVDRAIPVIRGVMVEAPEPAVRLKVPLEVEARGADNWEEAH